MDRDTAARAYRWCRENLRSDDYMYIYDPRLSTPETVHEFHFFTASAWVEFCLKFHD